VPVIAMARAACFNSSVRIEDHFVDVTEMIEIGKTDSVQFQQLFSLPTPTTSSSKTRTRARKSSRLAKPTSQSRRRKELSDQEIEEERRLLLREKMRKHNT
jgi:DNA-damage-inducible protein D